MGAWATGAFENDGAQDWLGEFIKSPIALAIKKALTEYINAKPKTRADYPDLAEASAQLLVTLTLNHEAVDIRYDAANENLYSLALQAIDKILANTEYLESWNEPDAKRNALMYLRAGIIYAQDEELYFRSRFTVRSLKAGRKTKGFFIGKRKHTLKKPAKPVTFSAEKERIKRGLPVKAGAHERAARSRKRKRS
jgi:hypothetical protein